MKETLKLKSKRTVVVDISESSLTLLSGRECMLLESAINREIGYQSVNGTPDTVLEICRIQERLVDEMNRGNEPPKLPGYKVTRGGVQ